MPFITGRTYGKLVSCSHGHTKQQLKSQCLSSKEGFVLTLDLSGGVDG